MAAAADFDTLLAAMRAELAALDAGNAAVIAAATATKLQVLDALNGTPPPPRAALETARALNALTSARVNMLMAGVERRLTMLTAVHGAPQSLAYRRDGRLAAPR